MNKSVEGGSRETVVQRIRRVRSLVRPAEQRVLEIILGDYPIAGLVSVMKLASKAGVSTATVLRAIKRLGFSGYALFQSALREELAARLFSPADITLHSGSVSSSQGMDFYSNAHQVFASALKSTFADIDKPQFEKLTQLLSDAKKPILIAGGYFSSVLAYHLYLYMKIFRPHVKYTGSGVRERASEILNMNSNTVLIVFDYRRYQKTIMDWVIEAKKRSAQVVLFTDRYMSPIASHSDFVIACDARGLGRFDSLVSGHVVVDLLIMRVFERIKVSAQPRLKEFERFRFAEEGTHSIE